MLGDLLQVSVVSCSVLALHEHLSTLLNAFRLDRIVGIQPGNLFFPFHGGCCCSGWLWWRRRRRRRRGRDCRAFAAALSLGVGHGLFGATMTFQMRRYAASRFVFHCEKVEK